MLLYINRQSCSSMPPPTPAFPVGLQYFQLSVCVCVYSGSLPQGRWAAKSWTAMALVCLGVQRAHLKAWFMGSLTASSLTNCSAAGTGRGNSLLNASYKLQLLMQLQKKKNYKKESLTDGME